MGRIFGLSSAAVVVLLMAACQAKAPPTPAPPASSPAPRETLNRLVDRYWDEYAALDAFHPVAELGGFAGNAVGNPVSEQFLADSLALERRYLTDLGGIPRAALDADAGLTYDIFRRGRELAVQSFTYPTELLPLNPFDGVPQEYAWLASGGAPMAHGGRKDFLAWSANADAFESWTHDAIGNLREGLRRGYTLPRPLIERLIPQLAALGEDSERSPFYRAIKSAPGNTTDQRQVVSGKILPAYRALHDFLRSEYLPHARPSSSLGALPLGEAWYAYLLKRETDGNRSAADLNAMAIAEVTRLQARLQAILTEANFAGTPQAFLEGMRRDPRFGFSSGEDLVKAFGDLKTQVEASMSTVLPSLPAIDLSVAALPRFREGVTPELSFQRAPAYGKAPAMLYVDTSRLSTRPALASAAEFLQTAEPGRLFQLQIQQERTDLPRFRRFGGDDAFTDGWGVYATSLGEELGVYKDPEARFGAALVQLQCALGAAVDTGVHGLGWSRDRALDYLHAQSPLDASAGADLVDRAASYPARATACLAGFMRFTALRAHAERALGARFNLAEFHAQVLEGGAMPLDLLEGKIERWMEALPKLD